MRWVDLMGDVGRSPPVPSHQNLACRGVSLCIVVARNLGFSCENVVKSNRQASEQSWEATRHDLQRSSTRVERQRATNWGQLAVSATPRWLPDQDYLGLSGIVEGRVLVRVVFD
jgi:hypothetical protein